MIAFKLHSNGPVCEAWKHQTPNTKHQISSKHQTPMSRAVFGGSVWGLELGVYLVFGVWCLVFVSPHVL
jgi:hypothetical protein